MVLEEPLPHSNWKVLAALAVVCVVAYIPVLNNGFISDDYVILERASVWNADFSSIFRMTPERFRITTYLAFGILHWLFGYHAPAFYCFTILLHFVNAVLLWKVLGRLTDSQRVAVAGALIFAAGERPQEAVMWLSAMNEELLTMFIQLALLMWMRERYVLSAAACMGALFSKESAAVILLLLPLVDFAARRRFALRWQILYIAAPTAAFASAFLSGLSANPLARSGLYGLGGQPLLVWLVSLHRLMFPWIYLAALLWLIPRRGAWPVRALPGFLWMTASLLPYIFLTYQNHVPSRHMYLASIGLAWALSAILRELRTERLAAVFVAAFVVGNIGYLWIVKDRQYERRAAPAARLIEELEGRPPGPVLVEGFPENTWIAKETARAIPGWDPQMIRVNESPESCPGCFALRWDPRSEQYLVSGAPSLPSKINRKDH